MTLPVSKNVKTKKKKRKKGKERRERERERQRTLLNSIDTMLDRFLPFVSRSDGEPGAQGEIYDRGRKTEGKIRERAEVGGRNYVEKGGRRA